ncbi:MAG: calcium-binding protein [Kiloniellales bacterium]
MNAFTSAAAAGTAPLIPKNTPFNYNVGVNYESWEAGRTGYSITQDLKQITKNFNLIKTFHDAAVGTANPKNPQIDPTQQEVITYVRKTTDVELVMGTNTNALAELNANGTWKAGLMNSKAYTDKWVEMVIDAFGSKTQVKQHLKTILLGNEIDQNGPPPGNAKFDAYYKQWIPNAFDNLKASLNKAGLGGIPVSTTLANYGPGNTVSIQIPKYINNHWKASWNDGTPFVLFNQYTPGFSSTDFKHVENYFEGVQAQVPGKLEVFVGETGYSAYYGAKNQADVYSEMFSWLGGMRAQGGKSVPVFAFDAFDRPSYQSWAPQEVQFGIYGENANSKPTGLKPDLDGVIPAWTNKPLNVSSKTSDAFHGTEDAEAFAAGSGDDYLFGGGGGDTLRGHANDDILEGHDGNDTLLGANGDDVAYGGTGRDRIGGGSGADMLFGDEGDDSITGGAEDDALWGGKGSDVLHGEGGADTLYGGSAADTLGGGAGNDILVGGDGDDRINGSAGNDTVYGGEGDDTVFVDTLGDLVVEFEGQGTDRVIADMMAYTLGPNIEEGVLANDAGDALLRGNSLDNLLIGNDGDNRLVGLQGDDRLVGEDGDDTLAGGGGSNALSGGSGEDLLRVGRQDDAYGGSGADSFRFNGDEKAGGDLIIQDFSQAEGDKLVFASGLETGTFAYIGDAAFSGGGNSEARFAGGQRLEVDQDGDGSADLGAKIVGFTAANALSMSDFVWL